MVSKNTIILFFFLALGCSGMVEGLELKREAGLDQVVAGFVPTTIIPVTRRYCVSVLNDDTTIKAYDRPVAIDNEKEQCSIRYIFHKNNYFDFIYSHSRLFIDEFRPENITYVGEDKHQWCADKLLGSYSDERHALHELHCVCEGSMCNGFGSPIHYQLLKMVKDIIGVDFLFKFPGFVPTKPVTPKYCYAVFPIEFGKPFPISTPFEQVTVDEKAECSIQYTFYVNGTVVKYVHGITQANRPADPKSIIYVGDNYNQWCSYELSYKEYNIYEHKIHCQVLYAMEWGQQYTTSCSRK